MERCCLVECGKPVKKDSKVNACEEHEQEVSEMYEEEYRAYQQELYDEWSSEVTRDCNRAIREYYTERRL
jgi:hypothetical protein